MAESQEWVYATTVSQEWVYATARGLWKWPKCRRPGMSLRNGQRVMKSGRSLGDLKCWRNMINREVRTSSEGQAWVSLHTDQDSTYNIYHYHLLLQHLYYIPFHYAASPLYCNPSCCPPALQLLQWRWGQARITHFRNSIMILMNLVMILMIILTVRNKKSGWKTLPLAPWQ